MKTFWILSYNASQWRPSEHLPNVHIQVKFEICLVFFWDVCFLDLSGFSKRRPQRLHLVSMSGMQRKGKNGAKNVAGTLSTFPPMQVCIAIQIFIPHAQGWGEPPAQVTVAMSSLRKCARKKCHFMQSSYGGRTNKCFPWEEEKCCDLKPGRSERREVGPGTWWKCLESCKAGSALDWLS